MKQLSAKCGALKVVSMMIAVVLILGASAPVYAGTLVSPPIFVSFNQNPDFFNRLLCSVLNVGNKQLLVSVKIFNGAGDELESDVLALEPGTIKSRSNNNNPFILFDGGVDGYCRFDVINGPASSVKATACDYQFNISKCIHYVEASEIPPAGSLNRVPDRRLGR